MNSEPQSQTHSFNNGGFSFSFNSFNMSSMVDDIEFNVENIPGFYIHGKRQTSSSRMVNGVGESVKQIILTLVPEEVGEATIPAFSLKDADGKEHSSEPIKITVNKPANEPDDDEDDDKATAKDNEEKDDDDDEIKNNSAAKDRSSDNNSSEKQTEQKTFNNILKGILIFIAIALIIFIIIGIVIRKASKNWILETSDSENKNETANQEAQVSAADNAQDIKKEPEIKVQKPEIEKVEFETIVASLKIQYKEINQDFYKKYFEVFKMACCYRNKALTTDMTFDELLNKIVKIAGTGNIKHACSQIRGEIEGVLYAGIMPGRQLHAIESDIKEILNSL